MQRLTGRSRTWLLLLALIPLLFVANAEAAKARKLNRAEERLAPETTTALITLARMAIFAGDGGAYDIWSEDRYVGSIYGGQLLQFRVEPGQHVIMARHPMGRMWTFLPVEVEAGKEYFVKANPIPFHLGAADARVDERISEWQKFPTGPVMKVRTREKRQEKGAAEAKLALQAFHDGTVSPECTLWYAASVSRKPRPQPTRERGSICARLNELRPEFGR